MTEPIPETTRHKSIKRVLIVVLICFPLIWGAEEYLQSQRDEFSGHWDYAGTPLSLSANGDYELSLPSGSTIAKGYWWRIGHLAGFHEWHHDWSWFSRIWYFATKYELQTLRFVGPDTFEMTGGTGVTRTVKALKPAVRPTINPAATALRLRS